MAKTIATKALFLIPVIAVATALSLLLLWHSVPLSRNDTNNLLLHQVAQPGEGFLPTPVAMPDFPDGVEWINTDGKLQLEDLKGKLVLLDFWTYCCINCMHILPVLDQVEKKYENQLVVVGVHTAKFDTEKDSDNIREAIMRHEIRHPVFNDAEHILWNRLQIGSWPTLVLLDPQGRAIWARAGEIDFKELDAVLEQAVGYYQRRNEIDTRSIHFNLEVSLSKNTPLRFPGKVLADPEGKRILIADSNHHRIVISDLEGKLLATIGSGRPGTADGDFTKAQFKHPQGMAIQGDRLYVADTENHLIRSIDLSTKTVSTIAGTGQQARGAWFGLDRNAKIPKQPTLPPRETSLASPWDLWIHDSLLYIAMAGTHQIWTMDLDGTAAGPVAGNGREDIVDGAQLPRAPFATGSSAFAQPSGLASDGKQLFVADSEGSSIRVVPFAANGKVTTIVGTSKLTRNRLFIFGDADGPTNEALFQHPLGVAYRDGSVFVADTYNSKVREINLARNSVRTLIGDSGAGDSIDPPQLNEPSGLSVMGDELLIADTNNHRICAFDLNAKTMRVLTIEGLAAPNIAAPKKIVRLPMNAAEYTLPKTNVKAKQIELTLPISYLLPEDWKLNPTAPQGYVAIWTNADGKILQEQSISGKFAEPKSEVELSLPIPPGDKLKLQIGLTYYYCKSDGGGLCLAESSIFTTELHRGEETSVPTIEVEVKLK
jgi:thiol-disulfide isomerase/thioredoxin